MTHPNERPAFEVSDDIVLKIEPTLAVSLGQLILESRTENSALLALGHQLRRLKQSQYEGE
ncbi:MAG TPA: hypothetical protein VGN57_12730 [Pirellulaceae bacterium]|jgi:hypothetical protein|nr:hypothetical protein [Pirellulaceae bacterium]